MKWLEKIKESKNINQLPMFSELLEIAEDEGIDSEELHEMWSEGIEIVIADGTKVTLEYGYNCFNDKNEWYFYVIEDIYICAECLLKQSRFDEIKQEIGYDDDYKLLPANWNTDGVRIYLKKIIEIQQRKEEERRLRIRERNNLLRDILFKDCCYCKNMINNECIFNNDDVEECENFEERDSF